MLILPISKNWIISRAARRVYLLAAVLTVAYFGAWLGTRIATPRAGVGGRTAGTAARVRILLLPGVLGAATLWVAMWYFWFSFDKRVLAEESGMVRTSASSFHFALCATTL